MEKKGGGRAERQMLSDFERKKKFEFLELGLQKTSMARKLPGRKNMSIY